MEGRRECNYLKERETFRGKRRGGGRGGWDGRGLFNLGDTFGVSGKGWEVAG